MTLVARNGVIQSSNAPDVLTIRFTRGIIWDREAYGPMHKDEPVTMDAGWANYYIRRGVAKPYVPEPAAEVTPIELGNLTVEEVLAGNEADADAVAAAAKPRRRKKTSE